MLDPQGQLDHIAEFADSSVRVMARKGSLVGIPGSYGFKRWLAQRWGNRGNAVYTFVGSLIAISLSGVAAWAFNEPLLFPSLGATAFLFFETPMAEIASPRNAIIGHVVAVLAAVVALTLFGLLDAPSAYEAGVVPARIGAVALAVAMTGGGLRLLRSAHPPAGATTIIVSSGLLDDPAQLVAVVAGVAILTAASLGLNRLLGVPAPLWASQR
jgi:CBS domain-containing membrane protein